MFEVQKEQGPKGKKKNKTKKIATEKSDRVKGTFAMLSRQMR